MGKTPVASRASGRFPISPAWIQGGVQSLHTDAHESSSDRLQRAYERQLKRAFLLPDWLDALDLQPGHRVLDIGAGTGYMSLRMAERVGPAGKVFAVDVSAEALEFLGKLQHQEGIENIERIVADGTTLEPPAPPVDGALVSMVLHHVEDPAALIGNLAHLLSPGARAVIAEFHPDGRDDIGPAREKRIHPDQVMAWCRSAGLHVESWRMQTPDHYMVVCILRGDASGPEAGKEG